MLDPRWRKLIAEEDDMSLVGSVVWTGLVFGVGAALLTLYLLDTRTEWAAPLKGFAAIGVGGVLGTLAARYKAIRRAAIIMLLVLVVIRYARPLMIS